MATLKALILAAIMMMCLFAACAEDLVQAEETTQVSTEEITTASVEKTVTEEKPVTSEFTPEEEELVAQCAAKHIKSCEQGRLCRQVICPTEAKNEVC